MKIYSAALGMTLTSHISELSPGDEPHLLKMTIEATEPLPMQFACRIEPSDIRTLARMALRPTTMLRIMRATLLACLER